MAHVADHLSVSALEQQYRSCTDVTAARHLQTIWLLAKGHEIAEVAATVSYAQRWVERLLARYNAQGPQALGDLRRRNGTSPSVLRRRDLLVCVERRLQAVLCRAAGAVCPRGRGGTGAHHRPRARQRRLAHRTEPGCAGGPPARLLAPVLARASARRAPLAHSG